MDMNGRRNMSDLSNTQEEIIDVLKDGAATSEEIKKAIGKSGISQRMSELKKMGYNITTTTHKGNYYYHLSNDELALKGDEKRYFGKKAKEVIKNYTEAILEERKEIEKLPYKSANYQPDSETLVLLSSDLHIGAKVENQYGVDIYNSHIAKEMMQSLNQSIYRVASTVRKGTDIDEIVILDLGDNIEGEMVYKGQYADLEEFLPKQIDIATKEKWKQIESLRELFGVPIRYHSVFGNHGKSGYNDLFGNFDTSVQMFLSNIRDIVGYEDVLIDNSYKEFCTRDIRGNTVFMTHKAKKQTKTASGRAYWNGQINKWDFDLAATAHWHSPAFTTVQGKPIFYNGALKPSGNLCHQLAVSHSPSQWIFGISGSGQDDHCPSFLYLLGVD